MAAVTTVASRVFPLGGMKMEVANLSSVDDLDTYVTTIQRPQFGFFVPTTDGNSTAQGVNLGFSGRTVTFNNSTLSNTSGVAVIFGF